MKGMIIIRKPPKYKEKDKDTRLKSGVKRENRNERVR
jgi:hypothetical protein